MADDDLYNIQNLFWIGSWQGAINEAMSSSSADELRLELMYRSYVGQGNYEIVLDEVEAGASAGLQAIRQLAKYLLDRQAYAACMAALDGLTATDTVALVKATMYANEGLYDDAMKTLHELKRLEALAMMVSCLISINCVSKANEYLQRMIREDEDSAITQLTLGWVCLAKGGEDNVKEATLVFQDLVDKFGGSPKLLNALAICQMKSDHYEEAQSLLLESLEKNPNDGDTIANLIACGPFVIDNPDKVASLRTRRTNQLSGTSPHHAWLKSLEKFEEEFKTEAASYSASGAR